MKKIFLLAGLCLMLFPASAQPNQTINAAELKLELEKLNRLGSALYIAAHPDDENTRLISYLANGENIRTAYLSLTRGDGGQNLIGTEKGPLLGVIRTQELLRAREIDGGLQYFSRANDFGYSKTAKETLEIWNKEAVLSDMVWVIRKFRPDVLITRFPPATYNYPTHGHHQASAMLAEEAFDAAGDPGRFPEQLQYVEVWQPKSLYWNTSTWFYRRTGQEFDSTKKIMMDVGTYSPLLGESYAEVAAESRSQHQSQGFGAGKYRGAQPEYLEFVKGDKLNGDLFEEINTTWSRVKGGEPVQRQIENAIAAYNTHNPSVIIPYLVKAYEMLEQLERSYWVEVKKEDLKKVIAAAAGLFFEAIATDNYFSAPDATVPVELNMVHRAESVPVTLVSVDLPFGGQLKDFNRVLKNNEYAEMEESMYVPKETPISQPYWLRNDMENIGMYNVEDQVFIGLPESPPAAKVGFTFDFGGTKIRFERPVMYKWTDRVKGELYRGFEITPELTLNIREKAYVFAEQEPKSVSLTVKSWIDEIKGDVTLNLPEGWSCSPASHEVHLKGKGAEKIIQFQVIPPDGASELALKPVFQTENKTYNKSYILIDHDHIPRQMLFPESTAQLLKLDLEKKGEKIGYIMGAGDEVPQSLQQIGYEVTMLNELNFDEAALNDFDAIVIGIRAYNTHEWLVNKKSQLMEYVGHGGNVIVQYQTTGGLLTNDFAPYAFKIGRGRVTNEFATVRFSGKGHPILAFPNKLTSADFQGWVQERGLYFAEEWDEEFQSLFVMADPEEPDERGSLLVADYGKGAFIYTGISFFRQLPAGIPGAYRLIANMISYEND